MISPLKPGKKLILINRDFQVRYIRIALAVAAASTVVSLFMVLYPLFYLNILRWPHFVPPPFMAAMAVAAVINFAIVAWLGMHVTHRIAGPMFSLVRHFRHLQMGKIPPPIRLRDSDDLKYVARNFNEALIALDEEARKSRDLAKGLVEALQKVSGALDPMSPAGEALAKAQDLRASLDARLAGSPSELDLQVGRRND